MNKHHVVAVPFLVVTLGIAGAAFASYDYVFTLQASPTQSVSRLGEGDSCAVFYPKDKAENEAQDDALSRAIAQCDVTLAQCKTQCVAAGGYDATSVTLVNATFTPTCFTRGTSCGWHAETRVTGDCGCACLHH